MTPNAASVATSLVPAWRLWPELLPTEAEFVSRRWLGDPGTLRATCMPGTTSFALVAAAVDGTFDWAVFSARGSKLDNGWERTLNDAQEVAVEAQRLWHHRCEARGRCRCATHATLT